MDTNKNYITLLNGQRVRVAFTLEAYQEIIDTIGQSRFDQIAAGKFDPEGYKVAYLAIIRAGELLDGKEVKLTTNDLGRLISLPQMRELRKAIIDKPAEDFSETMKKVMSN